MSDIKGLPVVKSPSRNTADSQATMNLRVTRDGMLLTDYVLNLLLQGRIFVASDADENDRVTGQTSFAATTPTLLLNVPSGTTAIPLLINLGQAGTVAGGDISVVLSYDSVNRYSSGGTSESIRALRTDQPVTPACTVYSNPTAAAATNARVLLSLGEVPAVAGAGTATRSDSYINLAAARDFIPPLLVGPAAFLVFSYAAATGPTWEWSVAWCEVPSSDLT